MRYAILTDFGSTYTKVVCVDLKAQELILSERVPSTVHTDAEVGFDQCYEFVRKAISEEDFHEAMRLSTSSAAGGLQIAVAGLTKSLSNMAGRNACFSAGGKLIHSVSGKITPSDLETIMGSDAEIILLCGGYEGGNTEGILYNAQMLSESDLRLPVIYAGNSQIAQSVRRLFGMKGRECFLADNIIPAVGEMNIAPTAEVIRNLFMTRITNMMGVGRIQEQLHGPIVPTPAAVLAAGELLSRGTEQTPGIGPFMMVDIGGATTDIYSYVENKSYEGARIVGARELFSKRTVEGDMGMRESSGSLINEVGTKNFAKMCGITEEEAAKAAQKRNSDRAYLADNEKDRRIDHQIACSAAAISARRHAGRIYREYMDGACAIQRGKNLTEVEHVIGTGGIIAGSDAAEDILRSVVRKENEKDRVLLPGKVEVHVDKDYVFFAAGLLSAYDREAALAIMKKSMGMF